ncbi:MAG: hypothetical protein HAW62_00010 [Endozoicomonadaceae bacterium]|nr:hypothetical protein [Endozoicomonadaceae bacterium]
MKLRATSIQKIPSQVKQIFVVKGYREHKVGSCDVFISEQRKGMNLALKKKLARQSAIELHIGHKNRRKTMKEYTER